MVSFRLKYIARDVGLGVGHVLHFRHEVPDNVTIEIARIVDTNLYKNTSKRDILCTAEFNRKPTRQIAQWLTSPTDSFPIGFEEFVRDSMGTLSASISMLLKLLRWHTAYRNSREPVRHLYSFEWSAHDNEWKHVDPSIYDESNITTVICRNISNEVIKDVNDFWQKGISEPLAHELFQEAWSQVLDNPGSTLVIGIAAAETGMKRLIAKLVPDSEWLIQNIQSPPLVLMLEEYLTKLPTNAKIEGAPLPPLPKSLLLTVKKAVTMRNNIVHGKEVKLKKDSLYEIMNAIEDLLYIFDVYGGQAWALECISFNTKAAWLKSEA